MKKCLYIFIILNFCFTGYSQDAASWAKQFGGKGYAYGSKLIIDSSSNIYICGSFVDSIDFDPGPGVYKLKSTNNYYDGFVCKLSSSGEFLWVKQFKSSSRASCNIIRLTSNNHIYISGFFNDSVDIDPGPPTKKLAAPKGDFFCRLDADGNYINGSLFYQAEPWNNIALYDFVVDKNDNIYATGNFLNNQDFDPGPASYTLGTYNSYDIFVSKFDSSGTFSWVKRMGGYHHENSYAIACDQNNNIYLTGTYYDSTDMDPGPAIHLLKSVNKTQDIFITKLRSDGSFVWAGSIGTQNYDEGRALCTDHIGNIYFSGMTGSSAIFISKMDTSGAYKWGKTFNNNNWSSFISLASDSQSDIYVTSSFSGWIDLDPGPLTHSVNAYGNQDIFISKFSGSGNMLCAARLGGYGTDFSYGIAFDKNDHVYTTGSFSGIANFGSAAMTMTASGNYNAFVSKLGSCAMAIGEKELIPEKDEISVYPNPTIGTIKIKSEEHLTVKIRDVLGHVILTVSDVNHTEVDLTGFPKGIYFITTESADSKKSSTRKLILQ